MKIYGHVINLIAIVIPKSTIEIVILQIFPYFMPNWTNLLIYEDQHRYNISPILILWTNILKNWMLELTLITTGFWGSVQQWVARNLMSKCLKRLFNAILYWYILIMVTLPNLKYFNHHKKIKNKTNLIKKYLQQKKKTVRNSGAGCRRVYQLLFCPNFSHWMPNKLWVDSFVIVKVHQKPVSCLTLTFYRVLHVGLMMWCSPLCFYSKYLFKWSKAK